jgi:hypothetical protein
MAQQPKPIVEISGPREPSLRNSIPFASQNAPPPGAQTQTYLPPYTP